MECGSLLPVCARQLARGFAVLGDSSARNGQQAGLDKSGSKLPHSMAARPVLLCFVLRQPVELSRQLCGVGNFQNV